MQNFTLLTILFSILALGTACDKSRDSDTTAATVSANLGIGCDHRIRVNAVAKHSWPYPADQRDLRWGDKYRKNRLKLKPTQAAFVTATVTWKTGELIEVEDSAVLVTKPRHLIAKRDLFVKRKVWDQGIQVEKTFLAVAKGEIGSFLFYNSRGMCMVGTEDGPGWTACTLDDAFEGLSSEDADACEQTWWVKVRKSKVDQGWMIVMPDFVERVLPPTDATR